VYHALLPRILLVSEQQLVMDIRTLLEAFPKVELLKNTTPLERLPRISHELGIDLWIKRDDLTALSFGGNKTRQLEFYIGDAVAKHADVILITGAVQSNYVRAAATAAAMHNMKTVVQHEERVPDMDPLYYSSGNVLLSQLLDVEFLKYPEGEDENGADDALQDRATQLRAEGKTPYVIHLGLSHPPFGALGYINAALELTNQQADFDVVVVPSGSGATHAGLLTGLKLLGHSCSVRGICVRREATRQYKRIDELCRRLSQLLEVKSVVTSDDIEVDESALSPGYGQIGPTTIAAMDMMARTEGIFLDPVYTAKTFAGLLQQLESGSIRPQQRVVMLHTGGQPAIFGYQQQLT